MKENLKSRFMPIIISVMITVSMSTIAVQAEPLSEPAGSDAVPTETGLKNAAVNDDLCDNALLQANSILAASTDNDAGNNEDALRQANAALVEAAINEALNDNASDKTAGSSYETVTESGKAAQADALPELCADTESGHEYEPISTSESASDELKDLFTTIDLMDATIDELQDEMTAGHLTSEKLTQMYIDRINAYDENLKLNSIISINADALSDAQTLDEERSNGIVRGPLHGIPVIVKANYDVSGMATSAGSNALANMISPDDLFTVKKLRDAGAVILAQSNMSEFAVSAIDSKSTLGGTVRNAYDTSKTPAGSSGGTAVAVTSNFAAAGLGTDTGGSIRNPAAFSNLYGIRPSKGLTSISGVFPLGVPRDTTGPLSRTAEDAALILQTMSGTDDKDDYTIEADADAIVGDGFTGSLTKYALKGKRIGYLSNSFYYETTSYDDEGNEDIDIQYPDEKVQAMMKKAMANMIKAGAVFVDLSEYITPDMIQSYYFGASESTSEYDINKYLFEKGDAAPYKTMKAIVSSGKDVMYSNMYVSPEILADSFEETEDPYTEKMEDFSRVPSWNTTLKGRSEVSNIMKEQNIDAIIYMNFYDAVPDLPVSSIDTGTSYAMIFGPALGLPEISIPMGFSDPGSDYTMEMPLGINLFADFGEDKTLMEIAYAYEQQAGSYIRRMPAITPALEDQTLNDFLDKLMDKAYSIDYTKYNAKPEGKVQLMLNAYEKAKNVNAKDPYEVYEAASTLASAYDKVMTSLEDSGMAPVKTDLSKCQITLSTTKYTYNGLAKKPSVFVKNGSTALSAGADYSINYSNNTDVGTASVVITGKGDYSGTVRKSFTIIPKGTSLSKATAAKKAFKVLWKKQAAQTTGYEIRCSTKKNFKSGVKTVKVTSNNTTSRTIKKLSAKKTYYIRIRTYKTINGQTYYSAWSGTKKVKTR